MLQQTLQGSPKFTDDNLVQFKKIIYFQLLYISTRIWVLHTPNTGRNMLFQLVLWKKAKKARKKRERIEHQQI